MKKILAASLLVGSLAFTPAAFAQNGTAVGAAGGAVTGAVVGGPVGAVVGGVAGAAVGTIVDDNRKSAPSKRHHRCPKGTHLSANKHCVSP
ncbi:YMGG-like glycine zipper-containing protein [Pleomorphomonas oryzae]|uniref:YMGG-like glycine zipper-containing protein n=1 Tax=Pleomorphomonas oryzae TaxID=261934 RepID=UPI00040F275F|nr:YMGG-like glycine zipper-containing protein [Pleomorphomonas oryzae]